MIFSDKLKEVQQSLREQNLSGWLLYDFHGCNSLAYTFLEIPVGKMFTRRFFYWIPQQGNPIKIVSQVESYALDHLPGVKWTYRGWEGLEKCLFTLLIDNKRIAMEYSPYNALPVISKVDAGTIDLIRRNEVKVVSSANLIQKYTSVWSASQLKSHQEAANVLQEVVEMTWTFIWQALELGKIIDEYQVQQFMLEEIRKKGCTTEDAPICAINEHSADPHYSPSKLNSFPIHFGSFILLDLWCKKTSPHAVYADITRVGIAADKPTPRQKEIFDIVKTARDETTLFIIDRYNNQQPLEGWQVDQFCREIIQREGYGEFFVHRTGHNIGEAVHGPGTNLDNLETHDFRFLLPGTCFSVEPGIYLPEQFGVRLEYDVYLDFSNQVSITGGVQQEIVCLG
jgi:Xaa-Pro dipeptidase